MAVSETARRGALITVVTLVGGMGVAIGAGGFISSLLQPASFAVSRGTAALVALSLTSVAAALWMRRMALLAGLELSWRSSATAGLFVSVPVIAVGAGLAAVEGIAIQRGAALGLSIHAVFTALFVFPTLLVSWLGSYGLGSRISDRRFGMQMAARSALLAAVAFMVMSIFMYAIGWRVGAPRASERATMIVVLTLSATAAALAAGASVGQSIGRAALSPSQH